jgi:hypothetical protein
VRPSIQTPVLPKNKTKKQKLYNYRISRGNFKAIINYKFMFKKLEESLNM